MISQVTSYWYWLYFYVNIMSMTLYVVSCDMFVCVQHIQKASCDIFEQIWYVNVVWQHSYVSMYIGIYQWLLYLILTYIVLLSYLAFFDISTVNCHLLLCELSSTIVWNTYILCHIYHFREKFQCVVQFSMFFLKILLTYVNTS